MSFVDFILLLTRRMNHLELIRFSVDQALSKPLPFFTSYQDYSFLYYSSYFLYSDNH